MPLGRLVFTRERFPFTRAGRKPFLKLRASNRAGFHVPFRLFTGFRKTEHCHRERIHRTLGRLIGRREYQPYLPLWHPTLIRRPESGVMVRRDEKHPLVLELGHSSHRVLIGHAHSPKNWPIASADRSTRVALSFKSSVHVWIYRTTSSHSDAALFAIIRCGISEQNSLSLGA